MIGSLLAGVSGLLFKELLALGSLLVGMSSLLIKELLASGSLLAGANGLLVDKPFAVGSLLAGARGLLVDEAMALILPQVINCPLPILVCMLRPDMGPMKNGPPKWGWRQQANGLLIFAEWEMGMNSAPPWPNGMMALLPSQR